MHNTLTIGFVGYGEVGRIFARAFLAHAHVRVRAYDLKFDDAADAGARARLAREDGVTLAADASDAARGAEIVVSAVTADRAAEVAAAAAGYLAPGQVFFDVNSASPVTKREAAKKVAAAGARYVEGAVMAPVPPVGIRVPILAGGPDAADLAATLNALGMNIDPVTVEPGRASAMKLCRSIMIKGIEALILDCARAAEKWDVEKEVYGSLAATFPGTDWAKLAVTMEGRVRQHGVRRAAEMREAAEMLADLGRDPGLARAVADSHERHARAAAAAGAGKS